MLQHFFISIFQISITTSMVILILKLLSSVLNKNYATKWKKLIWMIIAIRLIVPINFSLQAAPVKINVSNVMGNNMINNTSLRIGNTPLIGVTNQEIITPASQTIKQELTLVEISMSIWISGCIAFTLYHFISYWYFRKQTMRWSSQLQDKRVQNKIEILSIQMGIKKQINAFVCKKIVSPSIIGLFHPVLLLTCEDYTEEELTFILKHELTHYKRHDIWYKLLFVIVNAVHWFNPIIYLLRHESNVDLELSCDDEVIKETFFDERKAYSETILACINHQKKRRSALTTYFYGSTKTMKERFRNIMNTGKKRNGLAIVLVVFLSVVGIGSLITYTAYGKEQKRVDVVENEINISKDMKKALETLYPDYSIENNYNETEMIKGIEFDKSVQWSECGTGKGVITLQCINHKSKKVIENIQIYIDADTMYYISEMPDRESITNKLGEDTSVNYVQGEMTIGWLKSYAQNWKINNNEYSSVIHIDEFDYITDLESEEAKELGLTKKDMQNGYYIDNTDKALIYYSLADNVSFQLYDHENWLYKKDVKEADFAERAANSEELPLTPYMILRADGVVVLVSEHLPL